MKFTQMQQMWNQKNLMAVCLILAAVLSPMTAHAGDAKQKCLNINELKQDIAAKYPDAQNSASLVDITGSVDVSEPSVRADSYYMAVANADYFGKSWAKLQAYEQSKDGRFVQYGAMTFVVESCSENEVFLRFLYITDQATGKRGFTKHQLSISIKRLADDRIDFSRQNLVPYFDKCNATHGEGFEKVTIATHWGNGPEKPAPVAGEEHLTKVQVQVSLDEISGKTACRQGNSIDGLIQKTTIPDTSPQDDSGSGTGGFKKAPGRGNSAI